MTRVSDQSEEVRVTVRLPAILAQRAAERIGPGKLYRTRSEYIRDLVRRDVSVAAPSDELSPAIRKAVALHEIEGVNFRPQDIEMLRMFEREGWTDEECRAYITEKAKSGELFE